MSRMVSGTLQTGIDAHITAPSYLIELFLSSTVYLSSMDEVVWDSKTWVNDASGVEQLTENGGRLVLRNDNNGGSSIVLNNTTRDKEVRIYIYYNGDAEEIFRGYLADADIGPMKVTIDMVASRINRTLAPRKRVTGPTFTNILAPGVLIEWGNDTIRVES